MSEIGEWLRELKVEKYDIVVTVMLFFMGRAYLPGGIAAFGYPAFAACILSSRCKMLPKTAGLYFAGMGFGLLTLGLWWQFFIIAMSCIIFFVIMMFDERATNCLLYTSSKRMWRA